MLKQKETSMHYTMHIIHGARYEANSINKVNGNAKRKKKSYVIRNVLWWIVLLIMILKEKITNKKQFLSTGKNKAVQNEWWIGYKKWKTICIENGNIKASQSAVENVSSYTNGLWVVGE